MFRNIITSIVIALSFSLAMVSCSDNGVEPDNPANHQRLILIYAVASNSLNNNLIYDVNEIKKVAGDLDLKNNAVLLYSVMKSGDCNLRRLVENPKTKEYEMEVVKEFPRVPLSTEESRIKEVISYVNSNYEYPRKGLILWSHATGWIPWFGGSAPTPSMSPRRSFGQDIYEGVSYECNITTLAESIPEDVFDFIWFDCCYMANIETVYQLREKADYIVGYVTEIMSDGMPYDLTMPYLLRYTPDLKAAATELYKYYDRQNRAVTVSVMNTHFLDDLAQSSAQIFTTCEPPVSVANIQNYSRMSAYPFYDMSQLLKKYNGVTEDMKNNLDAALDKVVELKYTSQFDFNGRQINVAGYSGLSMHLYRDNGMRDELFYQTLDWFKATRED